MDGFLSSKHQTAKLFRRQTAEFPNSRKQEGTIPLFLLTQHFTGLLKTLENSGNMPTNRKKAIKIQKRIMHLVFRRVLQIEKLSVLSGKKVPFQCNIKRES